MIDLEKYIKENRHREGCPSWLPVRWLDVLMRITPGPLGLGMTNITAAQHMNVDRTTVYRICKQLHQTYPTAWSRLMSMRRVMNRHRKLLHRSRRGGGLRANSRNICCDGTYSAAEKKY